MEFLDSEPCLPDQTPKKPRPDLAMQRHGQHDWNPCFDQAYVAAPLAIPDPASSLKRPDRRLPGATGELRHEVATSTSATST